jgi:hypothetical protein
MLKLQFSAILYHVTVPGGEVVSHRLVAASWEHLAAVQGNTDMLIITMADCASRRIFHYNFISCIVG